jgi:hypothetical protein
MANKEQKIDDFYIEAFSWLDKNGYKFENKLDHKSNMVQMKLIKDDKVLNKKQLPFDMSFHGELIETVKRVYEFIKSKTEENVKDEKNRS